jgi:hypothetical protein
LNDNIPIYRDIQNNVYKPIYKVADKPIYKVADQSVYKVADQSVYKVADKPIYKVADQSVYTVIGKPIYKVADQSVYTVTNESYSGSTLRDRGVFDFKRPSVYKMRCIHSLLYLKTDGGKTRHIWKTPGTFRGPR